MTTEGEFQRALGADPDDHQTRLVVADWLQERGDPRSVGYRALGVLRTWPFRYSERGHGYHNGRGKDINPYLRLLPRDRLNLTEDVEAENHRAEAPRRA